MFMGHKSRALSWSVLGAHSVSAMAEVLQSRLTSHKNGTGEARQILAHGQSVCTFFLRFHRQHTDRGSCCYATEHTAHFLLADRNLPTRK